MVCAPNTYGFYFENVWFEWCKDGIYTEHLWPMQPLTLTLQPEIRVLKTLKIKNVQYTKKRRDMRVIPYLCCRKEGLTAGGHPNCP